MGKPQQKINKWVTHFHEIGNRLPREPVGQPSTTSESCVISAVLPSMMLAEKINGVSYNLAYINHHLHHGDSGRVVGYDSQHGFHHRHYFGVVEAVDFVGFEDIENRFESDWLALRKKS